MNRLLLPFLLPLFIGCVYSLGSPTALLKGSYHLGVFSNKTPYPQQGNLLKNDLASLLSRSRGARLTSEAKDADAIINLSIENIRKLDRETDTQGHITEAQFVIEARLHLETESEKREMEVKNTDYRLSSGVFRYAESNEENALREAREDLSEAIIRAFSPAW